MIIGFGQPNGRRAAIILAAGASQRLGSPKQLVLLAGETLLDRTVGVAKEAGCCPIVVVLGAAAAEIRAKCSFTDATVVINADWDEGMSASIACGVAAVEGEVEGALIVACDQPAVTSTHLQSLMEQGTRTASAYTERRGVPAYFPAADFEELMKLQGDAGARKLLKQARAVTLEHGEIDVDTPADVEIMDELFAVRRLPTAGPSKA